MIRKTAFFIILAALLMAAPPAVTAATHDGAAYSAEIPKGWTYEDVGGEDMFQHERALARITVIITRPETPSLEAILEERASYEEVKRLPGGKSYIVEYGGHESRRAWGMLDDDGTFAEISLGEAFPGMPAFLAGLKAKTGNDGLARIFRAANTKEVADWLRYATPHFLDEERGLTPYTGHGLTAKLPKGWTATAKDESVVFASPDNGKEGTITVRIFPLPDNEYVTFAAFCKDLMQKMGGTDLMEGELGIGFSLGDDTNVSCRQGYKRCLLRIMKDPETEWEGETASPFEMLLDSIRVIENWDE